MPVLDLSPRLDAALRDVATRPAWTIKMSVTGKDGPATQTATVRRDGSVSVLRLSEHAWSNLTYYASGKTLRAYDGVMKETLTRPLRKPGFAGIGYSIGRLPDPVRFATEPGTLAALLKPLRGKREWTTLPNVYRTQRDGVTWTLRFDGPRLAGVLGTSSGGSLGFDWKAIAPAMPEPKGYRPVARFAALPAPPQGKRRDLLLAPIRALRAYNGLITTSTGSVVGVDAKGASERQGRLGWRYDGTVLTLTDGQKVWRGTTGPLTVATYVAQILRIRPDALALSRVTSSTPLANLFSSETKVVEGASFTLNGVPVRVLDLDNGRNVVSLKMKGTARPGEISVTTVGMGEDGRRSVTLTYAPGDDRAWFARLKNARPLPKLERSL